MKKMIKNVKIARTMDWSTLTTFGTNLGGKIILRQNLHFSKQENVKSLLAEVSKLNSIHLKFDLQWMAETL